jgi:hypothetical protein
MNKKHSKRATHTILGMAALAAAGQLYPAIAYAQSVTISTAGSTALKNWFVKNTNTFTEIQPGTTININGVQYPSAVANSSTGATGLGVNEWNTSTVPGHGDAFAYQLAPKSVSTSTALPNVIEGSTLDQAQAISFQFHESGSVEGILELANDQIAPVTYVTQNVNRDPNTGNGVWVNYNEFGGGGTAQNPTGWASNAGSTNVGSGTLNGNTLGEFYANGQQFTLGGNAQPAFNLSGGNLNGGQNAVQMAISDAIPLQVFAADNTTVSSSTPWTATPQNAGYGQGNTKLATGGLGTPSVRAVYQSTAALNMPSGAINPRTGTAFGTGAWNSAELGNLTTQTVATTATLFVANPGTGLTQLDRTDAQWLETTGRLQNGASFNMTTRDVNSGTRNVAALETGIDPTWAVGANDDGNGNAGNGGSAQITLGSALRFSNKTAGGAELRPTVQVARMSVGTLSINDASGYTVNTKNNPIRALEYSDSTDGSAPYVLANYYNISDGAYTIFQNEQVVTLKAPDASYSNSASNYSAGSPNIQGDDSTGDVKALINNTINSVVAYNQTGGVASPAGGLLNQGFIIPQLMQVQKAENGLNQPGLKSQIVSNVNTGQANEYNPSFASGTAFNSLVSTLASGDPNSVTSGTNSLYGANGTISSFSTSSNASPFNSSIAVTTANYLVGNFNQNGVRDFGAAVVSAQKAQAALDASTYGDSAFNGTGSASSLVVTTGIAALDAMPTQNGQASSSNTTGTGASRGDLIVMGDYNGDGVFDGRDLYDFAVGASLSDAGNRPVLVGSGSGATIQAGTGTISGGASNFSTNITTSVLNKNVALDYLQDVASASEKLEARAVLTVTSGTTAAAIPAGSTFTGTDGASGLAQFTYDPTGTNAYNKSDVNSDGVVDFNDALVVDNSYGLSFTNQSNALTATEPTPVSGVLELTNLVLAQQIDTNTSIGASDLAVVNTALTGNGITNWYAYNASKTGPGTIIFNRSGGSVNLYAGASLSISSGKIQIESAFDPFTQNSNTSNPSSLLDTTRSLAVSITSGGTLEYSGSNNPAAAGIQEQRLSSLNVSGGSVIVDPAASKSNRTLLVAGSLSISGATGKLDLGNGDLIVHGGSLSTITGLIKSGYNSGTWSGVGIASASAAGDTTHLTALGVMQSLGNSFDGVSSTSSDVLVKYTYYGDANLDGKVDGSDYSKIDSAVLTGATGWANGDFNYDGVINGSDYTLLDNAFNTQSAVLSAQISDPTVQIADEISPAGATSAVPEPTTLGLLGIGAIGLLSRRKRR